MKTPANTIPVLTDRSSSACTEQLARFFPEANPVQVRAIVTPLRNVAKQIRESVLVEYASTEKAIFSSELPLEFDDRVRLSYVNGNAQCDARVVAVQYQNGCKAVAVQFAVEQRLWVKRP